MSISNVIATTCQYEALKYVSFPVQTLGKCAKMFPVMVWGILIMRKKYKVMDWVLAALITGGCTVFLLTGEVKSKVSESLWHSSVYGLALMLGYLGFDGFTSTFQDKLFKGYNMTTYNQMLYTTACSAIISVFGKKILSVQVTLTSALCSALSCCATCPACVRVTCRCVADAVWEWDT